MEEGKRDQEKIEEFKKYETAKGVIQLCSGAPGPQCLEGCKELFMKATKLLLEGDKGIQALQYGDDNGDKEFREQLAAFLSSQYGDEVASDNLVVTAGATQGLHLLTTVLLGTQCPVFVEDPSYFASIRFFRDDLRMPVVPVPTDEEGMVTAELDALLTRHRPADFTPTRGCPFWGAVYVIPIFNNPTGLCYSPERCGELVALARRHGVLVMAEDIYNLLWYQDWKHAPPRLLSFDHRTDKDYQGHVVSVGTFSKILAPGLRLGWLEVPPHIASVLAQSNISWGGGSFNHYVSRLACVLLSLGLQDQHLCVLRNLYKQRMAVCCQTLQENLPAGCSFKSPQGGFFVWVTLPKTVDAFHLLRFAISKHNVNFVPGFCTSLSGSYDHCVRLSISALGVEDVRKAAAVFCQAVREYVQ